VHDCYAYVAGGGSVGKTLTKGYDRIGATVKSRHCLQEGTVDEKGWGRRKSSQK